MKKAEVAFVAAAGAPPLVQTFLQSSERPQGGILVIGPEGGMSTPHCVHCLPMNLFGRSVSKECWEGGTGRKSTGSNIIKLCASLWTCASN